MASSTVLTPQQQDFPGWYQDVLTKAELAENGPTRGSMVIRPYGFALWEHIQSDMDRRIKQAGALNLYMPLFIPDDLLDREAEHVEGFSPELAVVTHAGGKELDRPIVVRPTSETLFGDYMAKWIQSYRDLPMLLNQWCNVVRWELRPRLFLRTSEFLWQEGHTAHATQEAANEFATMILDEVYVPHMEQVLGVPVVTGIKPESERFAGAINTMACEAMTRDGKALQMGTSHELGQNFAVASNMVFTDAEGERQHCWTTSWGTSTRMVGGLIMAHGDNNGLRLPPAVAPYQVVVLQIGDDADVAETSHSVANRLRTAGVRVFVDDRAQQSLGRRATEWEIKGVPIQLELGRRDLDAGQIMARARNESARTTVGLDAVAAWAADRLASFQNELVDEARDFRESNTADVTTVSDAAEAASEGFARIEWDLLRVSGERELRTRAITVRCLTRTDGSMPSSEDDPGLIAYVARSY